MTPKQLRLRANEMRVDATRMGAIQEALTFMAGHPDTPRVTIEYKGFATSGAETCQVLEDMWFADWDRAKETTIKRLKSEHKILEQKWT